MTVQVVTSGRAPWRVRYASVFLFLLTFLAGCSDLSLFSPQKEGPARIALRPYFSAGVNSAVDINVIRVTAKKLPAGPTEEFRFTVDPTATEWPVELKLDPNADYEVTIVLINQSAAGEAIVSSGKIELSVTSGPQPTPTPVQTFPGPPENLAVTNITIAPRDQSLLEGDQVGLKANITGPQNLTVTWLTSNPAVATVDQTGSVIARGPGSADITAVIGPKTDKITVQVAARAARVELNPATATLVSFGTDATFTGRVIDARNATVPGLTFSCSIADATIATQVSPCVFRARKNGTTTITATSTQNGRDVTGTASLKVEQKAVSLAIAPTGATFDAFGATQQFTASAKDATGNDVTGLAFTWSSTDANVVSVDAAGLATAKGNGTANIKVDAAGASAQVPVSVTQRAASITVTPNEKTLQSINETVQLKAEVKDGRGNIITAPVTWQSTNASVASVDGTGLVTANGDGAAVVTAVSGTQRANATINVERVGVRVNVSPAAPTIASGTTRQFTGTVVDANGFAISGQSISWNSSAPTVASINSSGLATGLSAGSTQISARSGAVSGSTILTVTGPPVTPPFTAGKVLVFSNRSDQNTFFINKMTPLLPGITFESTTNSSALTPSYLAQFRVVVLWEDGHFGSLAAGNAIGNYVANGGNVVLGTFFWQERSDNPRYPFVSGWGTLQNFDPFVGTGQTEPSFSSTYEYRSATLNPSSIVAHPLTEGVNALFVQSYPNGMPAHPSATVVASYANGAPVIAFRTFSLSQRVVAVSFVPVHETYGSGSITGDFNRILTNAIRWAGGGGTPVAPASNSATNAARIVAPPTTETGSTNSGSKGGPQKAKTVRVSEDK